MNADNVLSDILRIAEKKNLPGKESMGNTLDRVIDVLENESMRYRPPGNNGKPGGLVTLPSLPTIIVSDLHARVGYLKSLLLYKLPDMDYTVYEGLSSGRLQIVCVGDGFHAESRAILRWHRAFEEYSMDFRKHRAMDEEMRESLGVMMMVMSLKAAFPDSFHFLKGNHENIANENSADNRSFRKFVYEGAMVTAWFRKFMGDKLFKKYYKFEKKLPVFVVGNRFCVTHAEPRTYHPRSDLINAIIHREIIFDLTWTANGEAKEESVKRYLNEYFPRNPEARMFGGHRPVSEHYLLRAEGKYIQIHNPATYNVVYIRDMTEFSLDKDIFSLLKKGVHFDGKNT